MISIQKKI